jgi:hypothetical protein
MLQSYPAEIEVQMQNYYQSLSEKDLRRYAAIEAVIEINSSICGQI